MTKELVLPGDRTGVVGAVPSPSRNYMASWVARSPTGTGAALVVVVLVVALTAPCHVAPRRSDSGLPL